MITKARIQMETSNIIDNLLDKNYSEAEKNLKTILYNKMADAIQSKYPSSQEEPQPEED